jgi:ferric-dicitrate binding protein FerR (iron transport regulator)
MASVGTAGAQSVAGSVTAISGTVTITRAGKSIPGAYGTKVDVGDKLVTGTASSATITLTDGSQMELTDSSNLTIDENTLNPSGSRASTKVTLFNGLLRSLVRATPGTPPNYEVHTPNAVASARGTNYDVDHETGVHDEKYKDCTEFTHVAVYDGIVEVYNPTNPSAPPVDVHSGQKVTVPCGGAPLFGAVAGGGFGVTSTAAVATLAVGGAGALAITVVGANGGFGGGNGGGKGHKPPMSPSQ